MAKKEKIDINTIVNQVLGLLIRIMISSLVIGVFSHLILKTNLVEKAIWIKELAQEGRKIGFSISGLFFVLGVIFIKRESLLKIMGLCGGFLIKCLRSTLSRVIKRSVQEEKTVEKLNVIDTAISGLPNIDILPEGPKKLYKKQGEAIAKKLKQGLRQIGINEEVINGIKVISVIDGASNSYIEISLPAGYKQSDIESNQKNLMAALGLRSLQIVMGSRAGVAGLIIMHEDNERVPIYLKDMINSKEFIQAKKKMVLPVPIGIDIRGRVLFSDLTRFPHALIAGATNSGKSVWVSQVITTLAYTMPPEELNFVLIDPKRVEFTVFEVLPHVAHIEIDPEQAIERLKLIVKEMDHRYILFQKQKVKNIVLYNQKVKSTEKLPYIVVVVDELNDLMVVGGKSEIEPITTRIAQLARAAGIHLIIATQRPSVDVVTGVIKGNLPTRISFSLTTQSDYSTIFGNAAGMNFKLTGMGDGIALIEGNLEGFIRFQGPVVSIKEREFEDTLIKIKNYYTSREGATIVENSKIVTLNKEKEKDKEDATVKKNVIKLFHDENDDKGIGEIEDNHVEDQQDIIYQVALKIVETIDETREEEKIYISARRLRNQLKKAANTITEVLNYFNNLGYLESVAGKGHLVINEEAFYELCDEYEKKQKQTLEV